MSPYAIISCVIAAQTKNKCKSIPQIQREMFMILSFWSRRGGMSFQRSPAAETRLSRCPAAVATQSPTARAGVQLYRDGTSGHPARTESLAEPKKKAGSLPGCVHTRLPTAARKAHEGR